MAGDDVIYVQPLSAAAALDVTYAGGKGAALARLLQGDVPVPPGCVVSSQALTAYLEAQGVSVTAAPETIRQALQTARPFMALQDALRTALADIGPTPNGWAVRSSAVAEDSASASFAGIYDSFLEVDPAGIWAAMRSCWTSWWSERAVAYRQQIGVADTAPLMAVVIQQMVPARSAGVAFTAEPVSGDRTRMVINAAPGLGVAVVSGVVEPEQYVVSKTSPLHVLDIRAQQPGQEPVLPIAVLMSLGELLIRIEAACQSPQDVEWAWDGARCWILQSRPITTLADTTEGAADVWGNANIKDVIPGLISPFTWSHMRPLLENTMRAAYMQYGYTPAPERPLIRRFWGRAYFNISLFADAGYAIVGTTPEEQAEQLGGAVAPRATPYGPPSRRQRVRWLWTLVRVRNIMERARKEAPQHFATVEHNWREAFARIPTLDPADLLAESEQYTENAHAALLLHLHLSGAMNGNFTMMRQIVTRGAPQVAAGVVADLVTGLGEMASAEHSYHLWELSRLARQEPLVMDFLAQKPWPIWRQALAGTTFLAAWETFLDTFGHRALYESEIANPRWREQPDYLFDVLATYVSMPQDTPPFAPPAQAQRRQAAERTVLRHLAPWRRLWFRAVLRQAQEFSRLRENSRSYLAKGTDVLRLWALTVGSLLVERGFLAEREDVFFLERAEVLAAFQGDMASAESRRLVTQRHLVRQRDAARQPPELFVAGRPVYGAELAAQGTQLTGLPSSPGRVTGIARVVRSPYDGTRLQPGEILIAPSTDPGWTPLFLLAAGLVMETGGYLSHGAIVAREYGIPAVLNVPGATQRIPDGSTITLDGGQGVVQVMENAECGMKGGGR